MLVINQPFAAAELLELLLQLSGIPGYCCILAKKPPLVRNFIVNTSRFVSICSRLLILVLVAPS